MIKDTIGIKVQDKPVCRRFWEFIGSFCNYRCVFCYYKNDLSQIKSTEQIKKEILEHKRCGATSVDLSGGEPTIRKDFFELLDFCSKHFGQASIISNGSKLFNLDFAKKAKQHGLTEVLFSLHGSNKETYENITQKAGSFEKIIKSIENCKKLGIIVRLNMTVCDLNAKNDPDEYVKLIQKLKPFEVNFIHVNAYLDNTKQENRDFSNIINYVKNILTKLQRENPEILLYVRYVPFCYLKGFENICQNYYQHVYDIYDWNPLSYSRENLSLTHSYTSDENLIRDAYKVCARQRTMYHKPAKCYECKYYFICDGLKPGLDVEVFPEPGKKIFTPVL